MKTVIIFIFLIFLELNTFSQIPKGYYFRDIKGTKWVAKDNLGDSAIFNKNYIGLKIINAIDDTFRYNVWDFSDSLIIKYYDSTIMKYRTLITCTYLNNEENNTLVLKLNNDKKVSFNYNSISTGSYVSLVK